MNIKEFIEKYFETQQSLADAVGVTQSAVAQWVLKNKFPADRALKLSELTQLPVEFFLKRS